MVVPLHSKELVTIRRLMHLLIFPGTASTEISTSGLTSDATTITGAATIVVATGELNGLSYTFFSLFMTKYSCLKHSC